MYTDWDILPPRKIKNVNAKKHDSWDEDEDGIWKAPKVPNPAYKGPWKCMTDREQRILIVRENGRLLGLIIQVFLSMGGPAVAGFERTFVLQLIDACPCNSCAKKVQKHLKQIHGIGSILTDAAEGKVTISGSMVDPYTVITELEKLKKKATLFSEEIPIENMVEEKQTVLRKSEVLEGQSEVVLCKPADNNQSEVDPHTVITELEKLKKKATLFSEEIPIENMVDEKQIVLRKSEVLEGQSEVVLCKPADNNQVVDEFASSLSPDIQSKHEHKLELKNFDKRFTCNGCKEEGFRSRYRCEQCDYDLHHNCMFPKPTVSHELFRGSIFEFSNKRPIPTCGDRDCRAQVHMISCDACGNEIHGYFYHCKAKNLSLHPCCINLKSKLCVQGSTFSLKNKASSKCFWCNVKSEKGVNSGWSYVSECENYQFHVKCIVQMAHEAWKKKMDEDVDVYSVVLAESLNMRLVRKSKRNGWSRGAKFVEMIILIARTIIGILFGDPTAILAPIVVELLKN